MFGKTDLKVNKPRDGLHCDLCGCSFPAVRCDKCSSQIFCLSCDDMYHRHPRRRFHLRKAVDPIPTSQARPVLPMKVSNLTLAPGDPSKMPLPPPRKKKPGKSIFDTFRRGSPSSDNFSGTKKDYSWTDRLGNITKFMSNRPLPPVPDNSTSDVSPIESPVPNHDLSFIHKRVDERPPALPQRTVPKPPESSQFQFHQPSSESQHLNKTIPPMFQQGDTRGQALAAVPGLANGESSRCSNTENQAEWNTRNLHQQIMDTSLAFQRDMQGFGTMHHRAYPPNMIPTMPGEKPSGMHQSSSFTDLTTIPSGPAGGPPIFPQYFNPNYPNPYPMYPQYPPYAPYFGSSWVNLANPPPNTDADFSDQSEVSQSQFGGRLDKDKKARRSHSVLVDRMQMPGQFYPFGPIPPGYAPPWLSGPPIQMPSSPSLSARSLSRLSHSRKQGRGSVDEDASSSPQSRPKSSSSEFSKNRHKVQTTSSSEDEIQHRHSKTKASPRLARKHFKEHNMKKRSLSTSKLSSVTDSSLVTPTENSKSESAQISVNKELQQDGDISTSKSKNSSAEITQWLPSNDWQCSHCTFINPPGERICQVCCKTFLKTDDSDEKGKKMDNIGGTPLKREQQSISPPHNQGEIAQDDKHEMATLSSALDDAEKEINQRLEELLKMKDAVQEKKANHSTGSNTLQTTVIAKPSEIVELRPSQNVTDQRLSFNAFHATSDSETVNEISTVANEVKVHLHKEKTDVSIPTANKGSNNIPPKNEISIQTSPPVEDSSEPFVSAGTNLSFEPIAIDSAKESRDSSCQTQQVPDQNNQKMESNGTKNDIRNIRYPMSRFDRALSPVSYNSFGAQSQERQHSIRPGPIHRAHSRASLFGGRATDATPSSFEFGNQAAGLPQASMVRSLSRASLLGDTDNWTSEYNSRHRPDLYLSMEQLVERRRQENMRAQGLELVRMIREAEQLGFTADDIQVALNNCGKQNPVTWLQDNWKNVISTVVTLASNYGKDKKENDVGVISDIEARDALRLHKGNIWASVTECVEGRQRKCLELSARGNFTFKEILDALTANEGNVELAYAQLTNTTLNPFLMRIWGSGEGVPNFEGVLPIFPSTSEDMHKFNNDDEFNLKEYEDSDQDLWEDYDVDQDWEAEEYIEGAKGTNLENSEDCTHLKDATAIIGLMNQIQSPESDRSEYCDAYSPVLSHKYLSSTSIDEIYLVGLSGDDEEIESIEGKVKKRSNHRGTGFLSKLAALRKGRNSQSDQIDDTIGKREENNMTDCLPNESQVWEASEEATGFNPLNILKQTFTAIKDTVTGNSNTKSSKLPLNQRRTIVVDNTVLQNVLQEDKEKPAVDNHISSPIIFPPEEKLVESESTSFKMNEHLHNDISKVPQTVEDFSTKYTLSDTFGDSSNDVVIENSTKNAKFELENTKENYTLSILPTPSTVDNEEIQDDLYGSIEASEIETKNLIIPNDEIPETSKIPLISSICNIPVSNGASVPTNSNCKASTDTQNLPSCSSVTRFVECENQNVGSGPKLTQKGNVSQIMETNLQNLELSLNDTESDKLCFKKAKTNDEAKILNEYISDNIEHDNLMTPSLTGLPKDLRIEDELENKKIPCDGKTEMAETKPNVIPSVKSTDNYKNEILRDENLTIGRFPNAMEEKNTSIINEPLKVVQLELSSASSKFKKSSDKLPNASNMRPLKLKKKENMDVPHIPSEVTSIDFSVNAATILKNLENSCNTQMKANIDDKEKILNSNFKTETILTSPVDLLPLINGYAYDNDSVHLSNQNEISEPALETQDHIKKQVSVSTVEELILSSSLTEDANVSSDELITSKSMLNSLGSEIGYEETEKDKNSTTKVVEDVTTMNNQNTEESSSKGVPDTQYVAFMPIFSEQTKQESGEVGESNIVNDTGEENSAMESQTEINSKNSNKKNNESIASSETIPDDIATSSNLEIRITQLIEAVISSEQQSEREDQINDSALSENHDKDNVADTVVDVKDNDSDAEIDVENELIQDENDELDENSPPTPDRPSSDELYMDADGITFLRSVSPVRPVGTFRRMSFNTRKQAIIQERHKDAMFGKNVESKPWFTQKKVEPIKPVPPKRSLRQQLEFERKVRKMVSDKKCRTYRKAEIVVQLLDLNFEETEAIYAANECSTFDQAISFLQQDCELCAGKYPIAEIVSMVHCSHKACKECIKAYFTIQIRDRTIMELLCPFCNEPDITDEDVAQDYFNHLDIMLKKLVTPEIHELFQRKLRDRVLMKDPNFRWCPQCSSGFITDPHLKRLMCPDCNAITCASCRRVWEREHEGVSCADFAAWRDATDPEAQAAGLAKILTEDGIDCPSCHFRYALAKGGCMHFKCIQCQHDFCSGCSQPFKMGQKCGLSEFCAKLGLHAHHPRNCLFYLRDKDPSDLQKLLEMNDVPFNKDPPQGMEVKYLCQVLEQKESSQGMVDDQCGKEVETGFAGLCRVHYVEYLGQIVNKHKIDPIQIFENDDLELVLKRASIRLPPKRYRESPIEYRDKLVKLIEEELPLAKIECS